MSGLFGGGPKVPKDTTAADAAAAKKQSQAETTKTFLTNQRKRSQFGRQSTVLAEDEEKTTVLGG